MTMDIELGVCTFGEACIADNGDRMSHGEAIRQTLREGRLADQCGLDFFGVGEHHRSDFAVSFPDGVLAAIASSTRRIRLGTAVTVIGSDDPVRVYQRLSTLNAISSGRAETIVGRGSYVESFGLFGMDMKDYDLLFEEKVELLAKLVPNEPITWSGSTRSGLTNQRVFPNLEGEVPVSVAVGSSGSSILLAARNRCGITLGSIAGDPGRLRPYISLYRKSLRQFENPDRPIAVYSPGLVAKTDEMARECYWKMLRDKPKNGKNLAAGKFWSKSEFVNEIEAGSLYVGSPAFVANKIASTFRQLSPARFILKYSGAEIPSSALCESIELFGTVVSPLVRSILR